MLADSPPPTGPDLTTLPAFSGFQYWAYAGSYVWTSGAAFLSARQRGCRVAYEVAQPMLVDGKATTETAVTLSTTVPATALLIALRYKFRNSGAGSRTSRIRVVSGSDYFVQETGSGDVHASIEVTVPNVSQQVFYLNSSAAATGASVAVMGYTVPTGGE